MLISRELTAALLQERQRHIAHDTLARQAACRRACCNPTRLDRIAGRLGINDRAQGGTR